MRQKHLLQITLVENNIMTSLMNMKRILFSTLFMLSALVSFAQQVSTTTSIVVSYIYNG